MEGFVWCHHCTSPHTLESRFCPVTGKSMAAGLNAAKQAPELVGPGTLIDNRYYVKGLIGRGGQSIVYEATHTSLEHRVAIKFLAKAADRRALSRFQQEAKLAASIVHPNVCRSYDIGTMPSGTRYIVMERLHGESLLNLLYRERMSVGLAVHIAKQILAALSAAHAARVVHRDIKPGNVFIERFPGVEPTARVLDFGFAKVFGGADKIRTTTGRPVGTVAYMSPEQLNGKTLDARTDIYSVGVVLYEMLTGHRPFVAQADAELMAAIVRDDPPSMMSIRRDLPPALDQIVRRALSKDPEDRYPTSEGFQHALQRLTSLGRPPTTPIRLNLPSISHDAQDGDDDANGE